MFSHAQMAKFGTVFVAQATLIVSDYELSSSFWHLKLIFTCANSKFSQVDTIFEITQTPYLVIIIPFCAKN
jgi:hypothetical protein